MFGKSLQRHQAFWRREPTDRPLLGCNLGLFVNERYPRVLGHLPDGLIQPHHIDVQAFLQDTEQLYLVHQQVPDDYPYTAAPLVYVPWLEAIMGCPIRASRNSCWAEACVPDWERWHWEQPTLDNPWAQKLLELMDALVQFSDGRFPVSQTLMRGPLDMLAAMRGAAQVTIDLIDEPDLVCRAAQLCAEVWEEVAEAQLNLIPECDAGYFAGEHGLRTWAPDKPVWLQEDAMALLSPQLYREYILPIDRKIAAHFPCVAFHLHGSALWAIDELVHVAELDVLELNQEDARCDVEGTFAGWHKMQQHKPTVMWRLVDEDFWPWLHRVLDEFPAEGLAIQVVVKDVQEAKLVVNGFHKAVKEHGGVTG